MDRVIRGNRCRRTEGRLELSREESRENLVETGNFREISSSYMI